MHELSLCRALLRQTLEVAEQHRARAINAVHLQIGPLAGVEPELLKTAFTLAAAGTIAESAELKLTKTHVQIYCPGCEKEFRGAANQLCCPGCGSCSTQLTSGDELILQSVELSLEDPYSADNSRSRSCV
ncbi:hydrogenase maturation nickel metallochaperone HypA [Marinobacter sp.]|uniref:hydrogenase maturation nickel metallochaperone HypA n=1 Tax=Marinobacter sp. TaxID=50741 RepID=UPI00384DCCE0